MNANKRLYEVKATERAVAAIMPRVKAKQFWGELNHSESSSVDLSKVSHLVESITPRGGKYWQRSKVLDTPNGKILESVLRAGGVPGISTKSVGATSEDKDYTLVSEFQVISLDCVAHPSNPNCFIKPLVESITSGSLPIFESSVALDMLAKYPSLSAAIPQQKLAAALFAAHPELVELNARNAIDFDATMGNMFPGHAGFPSIPSDETQPTRMERDRVAILQKLIQLMLGKDYSIDNPGFASTSTNYRQALSSDPIRRASARKNIAQESYANEVRKEAYSYIKRAAGAGNLTSGTYNEQVEAVRKKAREKFGKVKDDQK